MAFASTFVARCSCALLLGAALHIGCRSAASPPPTVMPQVVHSGGPVLLSPRVVPVTFAADAAADDIVVFVHQLARSRYWSVATAEYGVGPLVAAAAVHLAEAPPSVQSTQDVEDWLRSKLMSTREFPQPTDETIYALFIPDPQLDSAGSHSAFALPNGSIVTYVVVATGQSIDSITSTASHELAEAATDPRPLENPAWSNLDVDHRGWELLGGNMGSESTGNTGGEIGDLCPFLIQPLSPGPSSDTSSPPPAPPWSTPSLSVPGIDHQVQRVWSNRAAVGKHDPCVPSGMSPYFNSAVVAPDVVTATDFAGNKLTTRGVHIPVGQTRTLELDLFSDEPTAPWTLSVDDRTLYECLGAAAGSALAAVGPPMGAAPPDTSLQPPPCGSGDPSVARSLDKSAGKDGDKIHLTLTMRSNVASGTHLLVITSTLGNAQTVWPLIVVE